MFKHQKQCLNANRAICQLLTHSGRNELPVHPHLAVIFRELVSLSLDLKTMNPNEETIVRFYSAFERHDYLTMQDCYAEKVIFYDPVFEDHVDGEVKMMWEMLCRRATDLTIGFSQVQADEEYGTCDWNASYTFSKTHRKINNAIRAHMRFKDAKIVEHSDQFALSRWCRQAFGFTGQLFGSMEWFQKRVRRSAQRVLYDYITAKQIQHVQKNQT